MTNRRLKTGVKACSDFLFTFFSNLGKNDIVDGEH